MIRTGFSFRTAVGTIENVIGRLQEIGSEFAPIADRASTFGYVRWKKAATKAGMKPIYGIELAVTPSIHAKKPVVDYWTFIAQESISSVNKLLQLATGQFRYEPLLNYEQALEAKGVWIIAGPHVQLEHLPAVLPVDFFFGLSPAVSEGLVQAVGANFQASAWLARSENKYPRADDDGLYEVLCGRGASMQTYPQHILSQEEWRAQIEAIAPELIESAEANYQAICKASTADLKKGTLLIPEHPDTLEGLCRAGAERLGIDLSNPTYSDRLQKEISLIYEKKFEDYFYIIADMMQFARKNMVCGPARGSSCGSLVCYLLGITTIDPLKYDLIFERFIDINRADLPDIDLDFSDQKRDLVFDYVEKKYGADRVARLGTVAMFKASSAMNEAGAALDIPKWKTARALDSLIKRSSGDSRAMNTLEDTLKTTPNGMALIEGHPEVLIATAMEGHPRHNSQHAAGIVLTQDPVIEYVAIDARTGATHCDKKDAEELNLLKIDALGLTQLSVFEDALTMLGLPIDHLESVPLDDPAAFKVLNDHKFCGIFQFEGGALQGITNQITIDNIEDVISITSLARPGSMATGGTNEWVKRKNGDSPITYPHMAFEPYLKDTLGIITFQEQIMRIVREIGDLSWGDTSELRRAMSKSLGKEYFDKFGDRFKSGAVQKGIPKEVLDKIWDELCAYGAYCFNRSHAVAYGIISYWCAWLKAHHPFEFAAATLSHEKDPGKQIKMLREMSEEGIDYVPVDKNLSTNKWTAGEVNGKQALIGPLHVVKGIGPKLVNEILSARARGEPMPGRAEKLIDKGETEIDTLFPIKDRFKELLPDPAARNIFTPPMRIIDCQVQGFDYEVLVFAVVTKIAPRDENEEINIAKRGGKVLTGPTTSLNLWIMDDSDLVFAKVPRYLYERFGKEIVDRGRPGKAMYAIKGKVPKDFRMITVSAVRYIGDMTNESAIEKIDAGSNSEAE